MFIRLVALDEHSNLESIALSSTRTHFIDFPTDRVFIGFGEPFATLKKIFPVNGKAHPKPEFSSALDTIAISKKEKALFDNKNAEIKDILKINGLQEKVEKILEVVKKKKGELDPVVFCHLFMTNAIAYEIFPEMRTQPLIRQGTIVWHSTNGPMLIKPKYDQRYRLSELKK